MLYGIGLLSKCEVIGMRVSFREFDFGILPSSLETDRDDSHNAPTALLGRIRESDTLKTCRRKSGDLHDGRLQTRR